MAQNPEVITSPESIALARAEFQGAVNTLAARFEGALGTVTTDLKHVANDVLEMAREIKATADKMSDLRNSFVDAKQYEQRHQELRQEMVANYKELDARIAANQKEFSERTLRTEKICYTVMGSITAGIAVVEAVLHFIHL